MTYPHHQPVAGERLLLAGVPVHVICNPAAALIGAACHGLEAEGYHG